MKREETREIGFIVYTVLGGGGGGENKLRPYWVWKLLTL